MVYLFSRVFVELNTEARQNVIAIWAQFQPLQLRSCITLAEEQIVRTVSRTFIVHQRAELECISMSTWYN